VVKTTKEEIHHRGTEFAQRTTEEDRTNFPTGSIADERSIPK